MRFIVSTLVLTVGIALIAGCSGPSSENSNFAGSNTNTTIPEYTDAQTALADGTRFLDTDEVDKAIAALNQAVKLDPDLAEAYFKLGVAYALVETRDSLNLEATPDTTENSNKNESKKPNSEIAFEKAAEAYKKVIETNPDDHQAHFNLGLAYNKLNEDENAAKALREAAKLNSEDSLYQTELGAILIKLARYREAIDPLKKALELDPENIEAEELLSDAEAGRKRIDFRPTPKSSPQANTNTSDSNTAASEKPTPATQRTPESRRTPSSNRN